MSTPPSLRISTARKLTSALHSIIAAIGAGLNWVEPFRRPFSLLDLSIAFPHGPNTVSVAAVGVVALLAPAVIIFLIVLIFVPGPAALRHQDKAKYFKRKLWELEKGLAGLALSCATAFFITQGLKNLFGVPRPDLLSRCEPDVDNISDYYTGSRYGEQFDPRWVLVTADICTQTDAHMLRDGFRSFPSGHSSFSWSGLLYLSLFICSKFSIQLPYLPHQNASYQGLRSQPGTELLPLHSARHEDVPDAAAINGNGGPKFDDDSPNGSQTFRSLAPRDQAAAPPNYLLIPAFLPIAVSLYINASRYTDFYHRAADIIVGSLIGIITAWFSFRWYHLPLNRSNGWAWGPRSRNRAWGIAVGVGNYVGEEGTYSKGTQIRQGKRAELGSNGSGSDPGRMEEGRTGTWNSGETRTEGEREAYELEQGRNSTAMLHPSYSR